MKEKANKKEEKYEKNFNFKLSLLTMTIESVCKWGKESLGNNCEKVGRKWNYFSFIATA